MSVNLDPLRSIVGDLESAVETVAEKVGSAVESDVTQSDVDQLVSRVGAQVERLTGLEAPATATSGAGATTEPTQAPAAPPAWTPDHPAS